MFWALLSSSKNLGVPEDSKSPTLGVRVSSSHFAQSGVATPTNCPSAPTQSTDLIKQHNESPTSDPGQWSSTIGDQKDQDMAEPPKSSSRSKSETRAEAERLPNGDTTPKIKLSFGIPRLANPQALALEANTNPFASPSEGNRGAELRNKLLEDAVEG